LPSASPATADVGPTLCKGADIFVYVRHSGSIEAMLAALAKRSEFSLAYMPDLMPAQITRLEAKYGSKIVFAKKAVDILQILQHAKLLITNAGHSLTMQTLLAGKPLLLLPTHWEQSAVANMAVKTGAAIAVLPSEQHPKFHRRIDELLQEPTYREAAEAFAKRYQHLSGAAALEKALVACAQRAEPQLNRTRLTIVG